MKQKHFISKFLKSHKYTYLFGILFMFLSAYIQTLFPKVLGETIDYLSLPSFDSKQVVNYIVLMILIAIGTFITAFVWRNCIIRNARKLECDLRERLFRHFQNLSPSFYNQHKTGDLIAYAINDISAVRMTFGPATAMSINGLSLCVAAIYSMARTIDWRLTLLCLLPIPFVVIIMLKIGNVIQRRFKRVQETFGKISDRVQENIYGIRVIKAYVQEESELKRFEALNQEMLDANIKMVRVSSILSPVIELCFSFSFILNLIIGGKMVLEGVITLGDFVAFNTYLTMIMNPVISIGRIINIIQRGMASYHRLDGIFKVKPDLVENENPIVKDLKGEIRIEDLTFTYPGSTQPALHHLTLSVKSGQKIGIIGSTGSGKTTLANLLLRLYPIAENQIYIDGIDLNQYSIDSIREGISYVPQDNFLFSATIEENITFFKSSYSQSSLEYAVKMSCIEETINQLPQGFKTKLGERGVNLSGGQKQRLSIARALIRNPHILILDDSLSAIDTITEKKILSHFEEIGREITMFIISHKISSLKDCDQIIVLDKGQLVEQGTHEELITKGGIYDGIYRQQSRDNAIQE